LRNEIVARLDLVEIFQQYGALPNIIIQLSIYGRGLRKESDLYRICRERASLPILSAFSADVALPSVFAATFSDRRGTG
jgi:hypothetical protein